MGYKPLFAAVALIAGWAAGGLLPSALIPAAQAEDSGLDAARQLADPSPPSGPVQEVPGQGLNPERPCECAIKQGACTGRVTFTEEGRRPSGPGAEIAYVVALSSSDQRCSQVDYSLRLASPSGGSEIQRFTAIVNKGHYAAGGLLSTRIAPDAKVVPLGVSCMVCGE